MNLTRTLLILTIAASFALAAQGPKTDAPKAPPSVEAKPAAKGKPLEFKGKVTSVGRDSVTVNHGDIPGFMPAMTMPYKVDKVDLLKGVKVGDQVQATVYAQDNTLYDLKVVPSKAK